MDTRIRAGETPLAARGPLGHTTRGQERPVGGDRLLRPEEAAIRLSILERRRTEVLQTARETTSLQHGIHAVRMTLGGLQKQQESLARMRSWPGRHPMVSERRFSATRFTKPLGSFSGSLMKRPGRLPSTGGILSAATPAASPGRT